LFGALLFPLNLCLLPFILFFNFLIKNKQSTTGYYFVFRKLEKSKL